MLSDRSDLCPGLLFFSLGVPHLLGKRTFLALKIRGHFVSLCCGHDGNIRILELGYLMMIPLIVSMLSLAFVLIDRVECSRYSTR